MSSVLEGRLRLSGGEIHVTARLYSAADGRLLWGEQYDQRLADAQQVQEEIVKGIVAELQLNLTDDQRKLLKKRYTEDTEAYQLYLMGRHHMIKRTWEGFQKGIEKFNQAVKRDPSYALAYSGLADCYTLSATYELVDPKEMLPLAKGAAVTSTNLDPGLAEAQASLALVALYLEWDWGIAEKGFKHALELDPNYANAHMWYGNYLISMKSFDAALEEMNLALKLDPLSPVCHVAAGYTYLFMRRYDEAIALFQKAVELEPDSNSFHWYLGKAYLQKQMFQETIAEFEEAYRLSDQKLSGALCAAYSLAGKRDDALKLLEQLRESDKEEFVSSSNFVGAYVGLGDYENALRYLQKSFEIRDWPSFPLWRTDPIYDGIRSDSRFQEIIRKMNLPQ